MVGEVLFGYRFRVHDAVHDVSIVFSHFLLTGACWKIVRSRFFGVIGLVLWLYLLVAIVAIVVGGGLLFEFIHVHLHGIWHITISAIHSIGIGMG